MRHAQGATAVFMMFAAACGGSAFGSSADAGSGGDAGSGSDADTVSDAAGGDAGGDGGSEIDAAAPSCFGPAGWTVCPTILPTRTFVPPATIDTETSADCLTSIPASWSSGGQPDACIITARTITITSAVTVSGRLPLVLVATDSITVAAHLEVASHRGGVVGPSANPAACPAYTTAPEPSNVAGFGGGGAGASFGSVGGAGGPGNGTASNRGLATLVEPSHPATLRGGCRGQNGGTGYDGVATAAGGTGGAGGGAVYLVAGNTITLMPTGSINASGAGATGGSHYSGGGGGGSGGMIALYAPSIGASPGAVVIANGGGASSGTVGNVNSADGSDPTLMMPTAPATGGSNGGNGNGGAGFAGMSQAGAGLGVSGVGGGGGGGGAGWVVSSRVLTGAIVSPAVVTW